MIEFGLIFAAGFLAALLIALLLAPILWGRAVALTQSRIAASIPTSVAEARAEKDRIRADYAMRIRKLEIAMKKTGENAALTEAEIGRVREENRLLTEDNDAKIATIATLRAESRNHGELAASRADTIADLERQIAALQKKLDKAESGLEKSSRALEKIRDERDDLQSDLDVDRIKIDAGRKEREKLNERLSMQDSELQGLLERLSTATRELEQEKSRNAALTRKSQHEQEPGISRTDPVSDDAGEFTERDAGAYASALKAENELLRGQVDQLRTLGNPKERERQIAALRDSVDRFAEEVIAAAAAKEGPDGTIHKLLAHQEGEGDSPLANRFANRVKGEG